MAKSWFFRETHVRTDCDVCGAHFDLMNGGVCRNCSRVLCFRHLHGSWTQRIVADLTGREICIECRRSA